MKTHDPKKFVEDLRDHLARHDRPLSFLFGAGTSSAINIAPAPKKNRPRDFTPLIPAIKQLTEICKKDALSKGEKFQTAWQFLEAECEQQSNPNNIESILSGVRRKIDAMTTEDILIGLARSELVGLEECIKSTIARVVTPDEQTIPPSIAHDVFADWIKNASRNSPIEIFTTNYDVLIERSLEKAKIPVFDGFIGSYQPFFVSDCIERKELLPGKGWVRLWKIHGSVNWTIISDAHTSSIVRTAPSTSGEMILPSHRKYNDSQREPYLTLLARLSQTLKSDDALLITCGYSFGDEHINSVLFSALENSPRSHIISFQYAPISEQDKIVHYSKTRKKILVVGPNAAVIGGEFGDWRLQEVVGDATSGFMDIAFDSEAEVDSSASACSGIMKLGDFNSFCKFLETINVSLSSYE